MNDPAAPQSPAKPPSSKPLVVLVLMAVVAFAAAFWINREPERPAVLPLPSPPREAAPPTPVWSTLEPKDVSFGNTARIILNVAVENDLAEAEALAVAREVVGRQSESYNAIAVHIWTRPAWEQGGGADVARVDYAPGGDWTKADTVATGNYSSHQYSYQRGQAGAMPPDMQELLRASRKVSAAFANPASRPAGMADIDAGSLGAIDNPHGDGIIVYALETRYAGVERHLVWLVLDGQAYALNGPSKELTPSLPWPRDAGPEWDATGLDRYSPAAAAIAAAFE